MHKTQEKLLEAIRENPAATIRELQEACGLNNLSVAEYHLNKLMANQKLRKVTIRWEILE